ncbi:MAG: diadenylate cyclase [Clostridia bacterium]|nr:diadenylate cyclase [Clostridia bacterium]
MENFRENMTYWITEISSKSGLLRVLISILDVFVLSVLLYICVKFLLGIMRKRSGRLLVGIFAVLLLITLSYLLNLRATFFVLETVMQFGLIAIVVIFQPEIRTLLENVGYAGNRFRVRKLLMGENEQINVIDSICKAIFRMSRSNVGALIIFQREKELNSYDEHKSVNLNSDISSELIENIFFKNSPLHDGAAVIRDFRLLKARVLFDEISNNPDLAIDLGSRHKACVGATEHGNDCIAVVVSEETGQISYAIDGSLTQNVTSEELRKVLRDGLVSKDSEDKIFQNKKEKFSGERTGNRT